MVRLSALVCVQNGDAGLSDCLRSLGFCDEVVVVADRCTGGAQEIARRAGARTVDGIFPLTAQRKAAGVDACGGDWILEIEPEERVDRALAWEIRAALQMRPAGDWFELPIDNYVGETLVRGGWTGALGPDRGVRLYRRGVKSWTTDGEPALAGVPAGGLTGALRRSAGADVGALVEQVGRRATASGRRLADGERPGVLRGALPGALARGAAGFVHSYLGRRGWREGRLGFLLAVLTALHPLLALLRAQELLETGRMAQPEEAVRPAPLRRMAGTRAG